MSLIFDIETDGLLDSTRKLHCIAIYDTETKTLESYSGNSLLAGIDKLERADELIGHNIVKFDLPALQKIYPSFDTKEGCKIFDTLLVSKLVYPDIGELDDRNIRKGSFPKKLRGRYSLKAWGYRLGELKGDYCEQDGAWNQWSVEMEEYCKQDVLVTKKIYDLLKTKYLSEKSLEIEHKFAKIIGLQEQRGVCFDKEKAVELAANLVEEKAELERKLKLAFPNEIREETFIPKVNNKTRGYIKGRPFVKRYEIEFNPSSRQMLAERLIKKYGWKPTKESPTGLPVIDEEVIENLTYPEAPLLQRYFLVTKTLGQLADGRNAWLKLEKNGVIYGGVDTIGAVTGRCTHNSPNLAQVPSGHSAFGKECRELFKARDGYIIVGCDASGLELRCLAHYMNDPDYTHEILNGDIHTKNQTMAGLPTRDNAKTFIYGFIYGAGDAKVGSITGKGAKEGKKIKAKFLQSLPKLHKLMTGVKDKIKTKGYLLGLDKRKLKVREQYKGLNVLLQSAGAIAMKKALCILYDDCVAKGWINDRWYLDRDNLIFFILNIHDEYQAEVTPEIKDEYKKMAVEAIRKAGEYFGFRCPLDGEAKEGKNWYETH
jgi:DNA polymerase I-like protein with 3'-5' exonuclease and polymerase domains